VDHPDRHVQVSGRGVHHGDHPRPLGSAEVAIDNSFANHCQ
jgi:hypothetical protein